MKIKFKSVFLFVCYLVALTIAVESSHFVSKLTQRIQIY